MVLCTELSWVIVKLGGGVVLGRSEHPQLQDKQAYWPTQVKPKLEMIAGWARNGLSNPQIALNLGIGKSTFQRYITEHEELAEILRSGREDAEVIVENALFKRACGYNYVEATKERQKVYDENGDWTGKWKMVNTKKVLKHVQGDVGAQTYWLEHRAPSRWEKNPTAGMDVEAINTGIKSLAQLLLNPVKERPIGSEEDEY